MSKGLATRVKRALEAWSEENETRPGHPVHAVLVDVTDETLARMDWAAELGEAGNEHA